MAKMILPVLIGGGILLAGGLVVWRLSSSENPPAPWTVGYYGDENVWGTQRISEAELKPLSERVNLYVLIRLTRSGQLVWQPEGEQPDEPYELASGNVPTPPPPARD